MSPTVSTFSEAVRTGLLIVKLVIVVTAVDNAAAESRNS
jgi:hypothetical protein